MHDGIKLYYEVYGVGEPLLLVHGNGGSIADFKAQIDYFRKRYKVIAMDSRDQGKSGNSPDNVTYEKMTDDLAALLDHLNTAPVEVLGWSDGAIEALLLGIRHPAKVKKIAAMAANLNPSEQAIYPEAIATLKSYLDSIPPADKETPEGKRELNPRTQLCKYLSDETGRINYSCHPARLTSQKCGFFFAFGPCDETTNVAISCLWHGRAGQHHFQAIPHEQELP